MAELADADLVVTNVTGPVEGEAADDAADRARRKLDQARQALADRSLRAEFVSSVGPPAEAIVRLAQERDADLIVVGTRKKRLLERLVEGSVYHDVLHRAKCDVLVVY
jgi:nucleotide-binding universal stress UspA family protein